MTTNERIAHELRFSVGTDLHGELAIRKALDAAELRGAQRERERVVAFANVTLPAKWARVFCRDLERGEHTKQLIDSGTHAKEEA